MKTIARPTEILSAEHRVIETVLDALEKIAQAARERQQLALDPAREALRFLRTFADTCHHGKEEQRLFPLLIERGLPRDVGPLAVMLGEHETGRRLMRGMSAALADAEQGKREAALRFADEATSYIELLREHIAKEDHVLFPMAEGLLRDADRDALLAAFETMEHEELGVGLHQEMEQIAAGLAARYGVEPASRRGPSAAGGCCGHQRPCH